MKRLATALSALAALALGTAAHAADISKEQRDQGMKEAPAAVQKAGLNCTVTDAYFLGDSNGSKVYEVACQQGLGYVVLSGKETKAYDCLAASTQKSLACKLPANADPKAGLKTVIASAGIACTPTNARYIGANATTSVYEVACQEGPGYILQTASPGVAAKPPVAIPCVQASGNMACTLTTAAQNTAYLTALVAKSGRQCQVSGSRYMGSDASGVSFYEIGCGQQAGFVLGADKSGGVAKTLSCNQAANLAGGCQLTSAAQIAAESTANYTREAQAGGLSCQVTKSHSIGLDSKNDEIVELACANRPDSVVALFPPSGSAGRAQFFDCIQAQRFGEKAVCTFSQPSAIYAKYTAALAAKGRSTCQVSNARYLGHNNGTNTDLVETACADGKPGWVIELTPTYQATQILSCGQAKASGVACELPTNARGDRDLPSPSMGEGRGRE